jgi:hypothetical protein
VFGGTLQVTITGLFGSAFGTSAARSSVWGTSGGAAAKAVGSIPTIISDATRQTIVANIHFEFDFIAFPF